MSRVHSTESNSAPCSCLCGSCQAMRKALRLLDDFETDETLSPLDMWQRFEQARAVLAADLGLTLGEDNRYVPRHVRIVPIDVATADVPDAT